MSVTARMLNILACPTDVFDEVVVAPPKAANWLAPILLVCAANLILLGAMPGVESAWTGAASAESIARLRLARLALVIIAAFAGTFWSAFVLWLIGRLFLKTRFAYLKALEVVALTGTILVLGTVVTTLLIAASGNSEARPALSLLVGHVAIASKAHAVFDALNLFHLWTAVVLALGLARLADVSFTEAAFWVLGFWVVARLTLILLA